MAQFIGFCSHCGSRLEERERFCACCGADAIDANVVRLLRRTPARKGRVEEPEESIEDRLFPF